MTIHEISSSLSMLIMQGDRDYTARCAGLSRYFLEAVAMGVTKPKAKRRKALERVIRQLC